MTTIPRATRLGRLFRVTSRNDGAGGSDALKAAVAVYSNFLCQTWNAGWEHASRVYNDDSYALSSGSMLHEKEETGEIRRDLAKSRSYLLAASERYFEFIRMQDEQNNEATADKENYYVPTRDISVAWCADIIRKSSRGDSVTSDDDECSIDLPPGHGDKWYFHQQHRLLQTCETYEQVTAHRWSIVDALRDGATWGMATGLVTIDPITASVSAAAGAVRGALRKESGVAVTPELHVVDVDDSGVVTADECKIMLKPWLARYEDSEEDWKMRTMTKYRIDHESGHYPPRLYLKNSDPVDLVADSIKEQSEFVMRVLSLGPSVITDEFVTSAVERYSKFLHLARSHPDEMLVPTLDVDLVWHAHMLSPMDYQEDTEELCGRVLPHSGVYKKECFEAALENTQKAWFDTYGTHFVEEQAAEGVIDDVIIHNKYDNGGSHCQKKEKHSIEPDEDGLAFDFKI